MEKHFTYYDIISHVVPGTLLLVILAILLKPMQIHFPIKLPVAMQLGFWIVLSFLIGHLLQGISSFFEPLYYKVWGGRPSVILLSKENKYIDRDFVLSTISAVQSFYKQSRKPTSEKDFQQIFRQCQDIANQASNQRIELFNASFAFHRVLLTLSLVSFLLLILFSFFIKLPSSTAYFLLVVIAITFLIEVFRARQRGYYFTSEVIRTAANKLAERRD